ncbi:MAG: DUF2927 domain-containing protein [Ignavibacteriales bacterium]|nr:DUF2927 domain-containing protein [Ignavibacteriales bacterium]
MQKNSMKRYYHLIIQIISLLFLLDGCYDKGNLVYDGSQINTILSYYYEVAFGSEFTEDYSYIRKWNDDVKIFLPDNSFDELNNELNKIINEINALSSTTKLYIVESQKESNFIIYLGDKDTYVQKYESQARTYVEDNWGLFWIYWNDNYEIYSGSMYVDIYRTDDIECQKHLLREELTQSLGLMNDSNKYPKSIFYDRWECTTEFLEIDEQLIRIHLSTNIKSGMTKNNVTKIISHGKIY